MTTSAASAAPAHTAVAAATGRRQALPAASARPVTPLPTVRPHAGPQALPPVSEQGRLSNRLRTVAAKPDRATARTAGVPVGSDGLISVTVTGSGVRAAASAVGGSITTAVAGRADVRIRPAALDALAGQPGVERVFDASPAVQQDAAPTSEGVAASGAAGWQQAAPALGNQGSGANVAIVDDGFAGLQTEISAGRLSAATVVYVRALPPSVSDEDNDPTNMDHCYRDGQTYNANADQESDHGTAVAEIVHQMAPKATLYLYCVQNSTQFIQSAAQIVAGANVPDKAGHSSGGKVQVASSSLGFLGESRGDGFGGPGTTEGAVQAARRAGVLWIQSAGNYAQNHWSGRLNTTKTPDGYIDLDPSDSAVTPDTIQLAGGTTGQITLTWDQWPITSLRVALQVDEYELQPDGTGHLVQGPLVQSYAPQTDFDPRTGQLFRSPAPELDETVQNTAAAGTYHVYYIYVQVLDAAGPVRYDLTYGRDFVGDYLASTYPDQAAAGSVSAPATSPYVLAVGAAYVGHATDDTSADPVGKNQLEPFSSRGPTVDGRVKPDLVAYDGVSMPSTFNDLQSTQYDAQDQPLTSTYGFYGTSAAAPHVAGAAALVAAANPSMDASQLEAFLEHPSATPSDATSAAVDPPTNAQGHGLLQLGPPDPTRVLPPLGSRYHGMSPVRIAYTVSGLGVPKGALTAGQVVSVPVPSSVPASATSVVISLSGVNAQAGTYLSVYPKSWPGNSTLNLGSTDANATVTAVVGLNSAHAFNLRNAAGKTDALVNLLGYFDAPSQGGDGYAPVTQTRVLDTRNGIGAPKHQLAPNARVTVDVSSAGVPVGADVAVINLTALNQNRPGYLTAFPDVGFAIGTVDYGAYQRSNLALVPIVNGKFTIQNRFATADAIVDVSGYFSAGATAQYVSLPAPVRVVNTATGTGGQLGAVRAGSVVSIDGGGLNQIPYRASALWAGLTAVASADGYLSVYPSGAAQPHTSNVDYTKGRAVPNGSIPTLSAGSPSAPPGYSTVVRAGSVQLYEDLYGYFYSPPPA